MPTGRTAPSLSPYPHKRLLLTPLASAMSEDQVALINYMQGYTLMEKLILIHEFGHLFGAPDHYSDSLHQDAERNYPDLTFEPDCIYGYNKDLLTDTSICSGCDFVITERCNALLGEN